MVVVGKDKQNFAIEPKPAVGVRSPLVAAVSLRLLGVHSGHHQRRLRRDTNISRRLQGTPDVWVFRAGVEGDQPHAIRTLHLIAALEPVGSLGEGLTAICAKALNSIGHEILQTNSYLARLTDPLIGSLNHSAFSNCTILENCADVR
jgi:hypothetical protein